MCVLFSLAVTGFLAAASVANAATVAPSNDGVSIAPAETNFDAEFNGVTAPAINQGAVVQVVPIPASALMMLGALGCLMVVRRRITTPPPKTVRVSPTPAR